jgi:flagellar M-ring protein FliF
MDFLNKAITQASDLFRSMTPGARITAGLLLGILIVSLVWLVGQEASGPDDYLLGGQHFTAGEVNSMEQAFGKAGLDGYTVEGNRIRVPRGQRAAFMGAIADAGALPSDFGSALQKTLTDAGPFITGKEREERLKIALQKELALWIRSMPGIENAAVAYDIKTTPGLDRKVIGTASVSVKAAGNLPLDESRIRSIGHMVASSVSQLKPEDVVVTDLVSGRSHRLSGDGVGGDNSLLELRKKYEDDFREQIETALGYVPGAQIAINVELNTEAKREERVVSFDKKTSITTNSEESSQDETRETAGPAGVPGTRTNTSQSANIGAVVEAGPKNKATLQESTAKQIVAPGGTQSTSQHLGLIPERVTASISIPKSYFVKLWRKQYNVAEDQAIDENQIAAIEAARIQEMKTLIAGLLPVSSPTEPLKPVTIVAFDDFPPPDVEAPSVATGVLAWLGNYWSTLGMVCLGVFSLLMLRSTIKAGAPASETSEPAVPFAATVPFSAVAGETATATGKEDATTEKDAKKTAARILKRREPGVSLKDELTELIREDPDGAASILRGWIGSAG